ncbi:tryptophan halogenase [Novosphingobium kunmingense]|uniref:Tryptophan halogenase n=1 Tax=Novosphingobium kunmingense TaxID=1211806 RepID=A0A2N0H6E6_9SPHN|nr:tryptophan halogenase family protein [Novosphingobium kunmingense]PKB14508.1 tryptophan halogenase [Novosphingobium kunmingense]
MSKGSIQRVVIVGGGTAGWLSASYLAARRPDLAITLIEAPNIPTIGVGEGTWPTMRETLATIGISEAEFLVTCDASFKQGSRFDGWVTGDPGDSYLHPFTLPAGGDMADLLRAWQAGPSGGSFAAAVTPQAAVCAADLAPRQRAMPDYAGTMNYAYHLDAGRFAALLARHAVQRLGVRHIRAEVMGTEPAPNGDIAALRLADGDSIAADLFIDCSGQAARLIEGHFASAWVDRSDVSFNDRALAVQVPVAPDSPIASVTVGTAHQAGWLWDIGLPTRRGIGCVYASRFMADDEADAVLRGYVAAQLPGADLDALNPRRLSFRTGHRQRFWQGNCVAIGLSAGFIEPLEASAIVLIELSLRALADDFPASRSVMDIQARRFDALFRERWERIVEFLKLHYLLSHRTEPYWLAHRDAATVPARLAENLALWRNRPPSWRDFSQAEEIFPAASQQYVLYGMRFALPDSSGLMPSAAVQARLAEVRERARSLAAALPSNRTYFTAAAAASTAPAARTA